MPLYLVRWPGLQAALVSAPNEDKLLEHLDEIANPEGCTWSIYRGPVYLEFALNAHVEIDGLDEPPTRPLQPDDVHIRDVSRICERDLMSVTVPLDADAASEMVETITRKAFPELHAVIDTDRETLPAEEVRGALRRELDELVKASWQQQQTKRRPDRASQVAATMGTSPGLVERWGKAYAAQEARKREAPPPKKPPSRPRKRKKESS